MSVFDDTFDFKFDISETFNEILLETKFKENVYHRTKGVSVHVEGVQLQNFNYTSIPARNSDDELKAISEKNKRLAQEIKNNIEEYERQQVQYGKYRSDQKLLAKEIKDTYEAFLMAKKYYKKFLKIYFTIESANDGKQQIYLQFFTDVKRDSRKYSVSLLKNTKTNGYEIALINPSLDILKELQQKLQATKNVPGALCYIRQAFIQSKRSKCK